MRTILLTGASGGIAQALVQALPDDFFILVGRDGKKLEKLYAHHAKKLVLEISRYEEAQVVDLVERVYEQCGTIDVLVNNAGYAIYRDFEDFSAQEVMDMFEVNTFALMIFCRLVGARMKAERKGHILNIVSMSGLIASAKSSVYSATKFAAIGFSNTIRLELAPYQVAVTTVNPGPVATSFFETADPDGSYLKSVQAFVLQPEAIAKELVKAMKKRSREVNRPFSLAVAHKLYTLFPTLADFLARTVFHYK